MIWSKRVFIMILRLITSIIILPGTVLVVIPGAIVYRAYLYTGEISFVGTTDFRFWMAIIIAMPGLILDEAIKGGAELGKLVRECLEKYQKNK